MNDFDSVFKRITVTRLEPGDYTRAVIAGMRYAGSQIFQGYTLRPDTAPV